MTGMSFWTILLIAVGLAIDAFAVSVTSGFMIRPLNIRLALRIAAFFGLFQALMPLVGWLAGIGLSVLIARVDHWIAFGLLVFIGGKMIVESFRFRDTAAAKGSLGWLTLLLLSVATSIDALAVGLSLSLLQVFIVTPALVIGGVTFGLSLAGVWIGKRFGHCFEKKLEILGGLILIGIGVKILWDHLLK